MKPVVFLFGCVVGSSLAAILPPAPRSVTTKHCKDAEKCLFQINLGHKKKFCSSVSKTAKATTYTQHVTSTVTVTSTSVATSTEAGTTETETATSTATSTIFDPTVTETATTTTESGTTTVSMPDIPETCTSVPYTTAISPSMKRSVPMMPKEHVVEARGNIFEIDQNLPHCLLGISFEKKMHQCSCAGMPPPACPKTTTSTTFTTVTQTSASTTTVTLPAMTTTSTTTTTATEAIPTTTTTTATSTVPAATETALVHVPFMIEVLGFRADEGFTTADFASFINIDRGQQRMAVDIPGGAYLRRAKRDVDPATFMLDDANLFKEIAPDQSSNVVGQPTKFGQKGEYFIFNTGAPGATDEPSITCTYQPSTCSLFCSAVTSDGTSYPSLLACSVNQGFYYVTAAPATYSSRCYPIEFRTVRV